MIHAIALRKSRNNSPVLLVYLCAHHQTCLLRLPSPPSPRTRKASVSGSSLTTTLFAPRRPASASAKSCPRMRLLCPALSISARDPLPLPRQKTSCSSRPKRTALTRSPPLPGLFRLPPIG